MVDGKGLPDYIRSQWRRDARDGSMTEISPGGRRFTLPLLAAGTGLGIAIVALALLLHPEGGKPAAVLAARYTARAAAVWFLLAFCAGPLARLHRSGFTLGMLRERRGLGLAFCGAHLVHLLAIALVLDRGGGLDPSAVGGALAYAFVIAMGLSSSDRAVAALGARNWKVLHSAGAWFIWLVFALSYGGALGTPEARVADWVMSALFVLAMLARVAVLRVTRSARA
jgi:hypothetical protein